jgi:DNA-binding response OmpR family regulator
MKLLVVDADRSLANMTAGWLKALGYEVLCVYTEEQARIKWLEYQPELVILDSVLENGDALAMCCDLLGKYDTLVLRMTEEKGFRDEVRWLEGGADAYLRKPFFPDQLLAHIHALTRRRRSSLKDIPLPLIQVGDISIDLKHNEVHIQDRFVRLTPIECKILHCLAINVGNVCTSDQIVKYAWDFTQVGVTNLVKSHIYHLRQKIEIDAQQPRYILTIPYIGYMLVHTMKRIPVETHLVPAEEMRGL